MKTISNGWVIHKNEAMKLVTILPLGEEHEHLEIKYHCKCKPRCLLEKSNGWMIIVHNAFDNREVFEQIEEIMKGTR